MPKVTKKGKKWRAGHKTGKTEEKKVVKGKPKETNHLKKKPLKVTQKSAANKKRKLKEVEDTETSPPKKKQAKRRVSFAEQLSHRWEPKPGETVDPAVVTPVSTKKSILKSKRLKEQNGKDDTSFVAQATDAKAGSLPTKKKIKLQITKKQKEDMKLMTRPEKKAFLKDLKAKRKPYFEVAIKAKKLWEKVRNKKTPTNVREEHIIELYELVKGRVCELIFAHDTVRVIQYLMALKRDDIRSGLFSELTNQIIPMAKSKYAKFFVVKMLKYGTPDQRNDILEALRGHVVDLFSHTYAADTVEFAYNEFAKADQRSAIISEFYGKQYSLFEDQRLISLKDMAKDNPSRPFIIRNLKEFITNVSFKPAVRHSLTHRLLYELCSVCDEDTMGDVVDALKERLCEMVHTKDGTVSSCYCLWAADTKERKVIVKSMKGLVVKMAKEEYGHWLLLALFDTIDDTVLIKKAVLSELISHLGELAENQYSLKVLLYLLKPRDANHFNKEIRELLEKGDGNSWSKKDCLVRRDELRHAIAQPLLDFVAEQMNELLKAPNTTLLVQSALIQNNGEKRGCYEAIAQVAGSEFEACPLQGEYHLVERKHGSFMLKNVLDNDKTLEGEGKLTLSSVLADKLTPAQLATWTACNKGAFVLLKMFESGNKTVEKRIKEASGLAVKRLHTYSHQGAMLLRQKVLAEHV